MNKKIFLLSRADVVANVAQTKERLNVAAYVYVMCHTCIHVSMCECTCVRTFVHVRV